MGGLKIKQGFHQSLVVLWHSRGVSKWKKEIE